MRLSPTIDRGMCPLISVALHLVLQHLSLYYNNGALLVQRIAGSCTRRRDKPYLRLGLALLAACGVGCRRDLRRARIVLNLSRRKLAFLSRGTLCARLGPGPARRARAHLTCLWPQTPTAGQRGGEA